MGLGVLLDCSGVQCGGERGIRTLDTLLTYTHFPGVLLKPLGHLSKKIIITNDRPFVSINCSSQQFSFWQKCLTAFCQNENCLTYRALATRTPKGFKHTPGLRANDTPGNILTEDLPRRGRRFRWFPSSCFTAIKLSRHSGMDRRNPDCRDANNLCHPWSLGSGDPCRNDEFANRNP